MVIHGFTGINSMGVNVGLISIIASITSSILPNDRQFDAMDLSTRLLGGSPSPRQEWFFYGQPGQPMGDSCRQPQVGLWVLGVSRLKKKNTGDEVTKIISGHPLTTFRSQHRCSRTAQHC